MSALGTLLFTSGFLASDEEMIVGSAAENGFTLYGNHRIDDWRCLVFVQNQH
jgi:ribosomal protein L11 methylase PrmA